MEEIQQKAIETYTKNLEYLQQNHNDLFNRINALSSFIDSGEYIERYHLEYIQEENAFDLYDTKTQTFVYNKQPNKFDKEAVKNTNFDKNNSIDLFQHAYYNTIDILDEDEWEDTYIKTGIVVSNHLVEYTKIFNKHTSAEKTFKNLEEFIFVGTLLGTHIPKIAKKMDSSLFFICEENLEIFRLSLFITRYDLIANNAKIIFSIMEEENIFIDKLHQFYNTYFKSKYIFKYYATNYNMGNYFERIVNLIAKVSPFKFTYVRTLRHLLERSLSNMKEYPTINTTNRYNILQDMPVLLLGAGPSLHKNIEWLQENMNNYFIIAIGAAVATLIKNDIKPNLITSVDAGADLIHHFPESIKSSIEDIPFLTAHMTDKNILKQFNPKNTFLFEVMTKFKETTDQIDGHSISEVSLHIAFVLGANEVYLLGIDLALDQETGASHIGDHQYNKVHDVTNKKLNSFMETNSYHTKETNLTVKGNFRESVVTTVVFNRSIISFNRIIQMFLDKSTIYNLSDGAFIEHTIPLQIKDIEPNKKIDLKNIDIEEFLQKNSSKQFSNNDLAIFKKSLDIINTILTEIDKIDKINVKTYDDFTYLRKNILTLILMCEKNFKNLSMNFLANYVLITEPYLAYQFNDKDVKEANCIKKVKKVWIKQIRELCNRYIDIVEHSIQGI